MGLRPWLNGSAKARPKGERPNKIKLPTSLPLLQIVEQPGKLLTNHLGQLVFVHHHTDVPRLVEPRSPLPGLAKMMLQAIGRVKKRQVTAIVPAVTIANAQVHIDAIFKVAEGQRAHLYDNFSEII